MPQHLAFEGADWGHTDTQVQAFDTDDYDHPDPTTESTWDELLEYHSGDLYDHYVAPSQIIEDQFDYEQEHPEHQEEYHTEDSLQQDTLMMRTMMLKTLQEMKNHSKMIFNDNHASKKRVICSSKRSKYTSLKNG
jgi:hypothetical protein